MSARVLVVDDVLPNVKLLAAKLTREYFDVITAYNGPEALERIKKESPDIVLLDVMMPGESGLDLTESLRRESQVPILLLTARGELDDRIAGLEAGADDYMSKPFEPRELVLRITSILRRVPRPVEPMADLRIGRWTFVPDREELRAGDETVRLTSAEAALLRVLAGRPGAILTREELADRAGIVGNARTVDVQVSRLRSKLEDDPRLPRYLHTVRGEGYVLRPE